MKLQLRCANRKQAFVNCPAGIKLAIQFTERSEKSWRSQSLMRKHQFIKHAKRADRTVCSFQILLILALAGCFCLLLALYAGLLIALSLSELCENAGSLTLSLESTKSAIQRFIFFYSYFCHYLSLPSHCKQREFFSNSTQYNNTSNLLCQVKV